MHIDIVEQLPSPADYNWLRQSAGWGTFDLAHIAQCLPRSLYGLCAVSKGETVGMGRLVGDGGLVVYVQDLIVLPAYRGHGTARRLMDGLMAWISDHMAPNAVVGLMAAAGLEGFYAGYGFVARPYGTYGAGMHWMRPPAPSADAGPPQCGDQAAD